MNFDNKQQVMSDVINLAKTVVENQPDPGMPWYQVVALIATPLAILSGAIFGWVKYFRGPSE